jgi:RHS repeat-associated protein
MLQNTQTFGRALIAALALASTGSVGFAAEDHYYINDPLATTVAIADSAGEIAAMEADAFGAPLAIGEAPGRFTGKPYDADLGAFVFPFRNYRPEEGRWMSADPSGFPDGVNACSYTSNPLLYGDPLGLRVELISIEHTTKRELQVNYVTAVGAGVLGGVVVVGTGGTLGAAAVTGGITVGGTALIDFFEDFADDPTENWYNSYGEVGDKQFVKNIVGEKITNWSVAFFSLKAVFTRSTSQTTTMIYE